MHYYLYEIKNNINGKIYIGVHKTKNLNDGYMGSGKRIKKAIKKYGEENFTKIILEKFNSAKEMYLKEKQIVTPAFLKRENVYNVMRGGYGGFEHLNNGSKEHKKRCKKAGKKGANTIKRKKIGIFAPNFKYSFSVCLENQKLGNSPESRAKAVLSARKTFAKIEHQKGKKNSQFGTIWITNNITNKKIKKTDNIPVGWKKGRIKV